MMDRSKRRKSPVESSIFVLIAVPLAFWALVAMLIAKWA
jgi:hypothetical protein